MKRSEINKALRRMEDMIREYRISLPDFCSFTPEEWKKKGHEYDEVRDNISVRQYHCRALTLKERICNHLDQQPGITLRMR